MYRHPFANPEHLYGYGRAYSPDIIDRRSPTPGPYGQYAYQSFMPMDSQTSFFSDRRDVPFAKSNPPTGRSRSASLPERRLHKPRHVNDLTPTWGEGFDDEVLSEPARRGSAWKRTLQRIRRRAHRGLQKVRALLHRDDRRSVSGFSLP